MKDGHTHARAREASAVVSVQFGVREREFPVGLIHRFSGIVRTLDNEGYPVERFSVEQGPMAIEHNAVIDLARARSLLAQSADQFRLYETHHRDKAAEMQMQRDGDYEDEGGPTMQQIVDTLDKAEVNAEIAGRIEAFLQEVRVAPPPGSGFDEEVLEAMRQTFEDKGLPVGREEV